jgi:hypothetical protein
VGRPLHTNGQFIAWSELKGQTYHFHIVVVHGTVDNLLGRSIASCMGLIIRVENFEEVFGHIGLLDTESVKIVLKDAAEPYALSVARRVPLPLQAKVKEELDRLESAGVIEPITKPTSWCAPMVPVMKKLGKIRICVDLKRLNQEVKRETFILPTIDDVTSK